MFNYPFEQCAQGQSKEVRAAALTIFLKMGAKNREQNKCILMTLFVWNYFEHSSTQIKQQIYVKYLI